MGFLLCFALLCFLCFGGDGTFLFGHNPHLRLSSGWHQLLLLQPGFTNISNSSIHISVKDKEARLSRVMLSRHYSEGGVVCSWLRCKQKQQPPTKTPTSLTFLHEQPPLSSACPWHSMARNHDTSHHIGRRVRVRGQPFDPHPLVQQFFFFFLLFVCCSLSFFIFSLPFSVAPPPFLSFFFLLFLLLLFCLLLVDWGVGVREKEREAAIIKQVSTQKLGGLRLSHVRLQLKQTTASLSSQLSFPSLAQLLFSLGFSHSLLFLSFALLPACLLSVSSLSPFYNHFPKQQVRHFSSLFSLLSFVLKSSLRTALFVFVFCFFACLLACCLSQEVGLGGLLVQLCLPPYASPHPHSSPNKHTSTHIHIHSHPHTHKKKK